MKTMLVACTTFMVTSAACVVDALAQTTSLATSSSLSSHSVTLSLVTLGAWLTSAVTFGVVVFRWIGAQRNSLVMEAARVAATEASNAARAAVEQHVGDLRRHIDDRFGDIYEHLAVLRAQSNLDRHSTIID